MLRVPWVLVSSDAIDTSVDLALSPALPLSPALALELALVPMLEDAAAR